MNLALMDQLAEMPIIAAVKSDEDCEKALESDCRVIFLLYGTISTVTEQIRRVKEKGKTAIVHLDLIEGLEHSVAAAEFIRNFTEADGVISTKLAVIRAAKELGLYAIQRFFLIDSLALSNVEKYIQQGLPDMIEILPGVMPKIIRKLSGISPVPVIAGGLISDKEDIISALSAGAAAVSTSLREIWNEV